MMFLKIVTLLVLYVTGEAAFEKSYSIDNHPAWSWIPNDLCGKRKARLRMIGGDEANIRQFPWMARLGKRVIKKGKFSGKFTCGGALITKFYVLSAAHCGTELDTVRLGENKAGTKNCDNRRCSGPATDISIDSFFLNNYDNVTYTNDIMLVLMKTPVEFKASILPLCLPRGQILEMNLKGKIFRIAGWGVTDTEKNTISENLVFISAPIVDDDKCNKLYKHALADTQYCVGLGKGRDSCTGDSGGPMTRAIHVDGKTRTYIIGIVSYGLAICGTGPGIYTKVVPFMPWILDHITKH